MYEVELKVRADHGAVRDALRGAGADPLGRVHQTDVYLDAPDRDFAETDEALRIRRERPLVHSARDRDRGGADADTSDDAAPDADADPVADDDGGPAAGTDADPAPDADADPAPDADADGGTATLTYKGPLLEAESKSRREVESVVDDPVAVEELFDALGYAPAATVEKDRERWALDGFTVGLDAVTGLEEYVEIECEVAGRDAVPDTRDRARTLLSTLDLDPDEQVRTSYLALVLAEAEADAD